MNKCGYFMPDFSHQGGTFTQFQNQNRKKKEVK